MLLGICLQQLQVGKWMVGSTWRSLSEEGTAPVGAVYL